MGTATRPHTQGHGDADVMAIPLLDRTVLNTFDGACAAHPGRPFLVTPTTELTYGDVSEQVSFAAGALRARGVTSGTRVAIMMANSPDYVVLVMALARLRALPVALNVEARGDLLRYYVSDSASVLACVDEAGLAAFREASLTCPTLLVTAEDGLAVLGESQPLRTAPEAVSFSDPFMVLYTSGSTGMPKAVAVTHAQVVTCGMVFADHLELGAEDRLYTCLPFFHINATAYTLSGALVVGAAVALGPRFSARRFWRDVRELGGTQINAMGSMLRILELAEPHPDETSHAVRSMFLTPLPADAYAAERRFGLRFVTTYAQTEWVPSTMTRIGDGYDRPDGVAGPVLDCTELRIVDQDDVPLPSGTIGEIVLRAPEPFTTFQGYLGRPQDTVDAFRNLWFHTGDLGELSDDGWLFYRGRVKDVIRRRGENISAVVVESGLMGHPDVAEVAAVPVPSELGEDEVFVFVLPREGATLTARGLDAYARDVLPRYMVPRYAKMVDELPRTATNKIAKTSLVQVARSAVENGEVEMLHDR